MQDSTKNMQKIHEIVDFWFSYDAATWFGGGPDFDAIIQEKFQQDYDHAITGQYDSWLENDTGALALILILDQFSRNIFRDDPRAFEWDFKALYATKLALKKGYFDTLDGDKKLFLIMPLMHSESLPDQELSVAIFEKMAEKDEKYSPNLKFAREHRDRIRQF